MRLKSEIATHKITNNFGIKHINVLLIGEIGVGKSSLFNTIESIFAGHVTSRANAGRALESLTKQIINHYIRIGMKYPYFSIDNISSPMEMHWIVKINLSTLDFVIQWG